MKGKPNVATNRADAYCKLTSTFPEGLFHGYSYPNLLNGEDYTLEILSGKRGEAGSISVNESDGGDGGQDGLDLGSGAGSDCDEEEGDQDSQVFREVSLAFPRFIFTICSASSPPPRRWAVPWAACCSLRVPRRKKGATTRRTSRPWTAARKHPQVLAAPRGKTADSPTNP